MHTKNLFVHLQTIFLVLERERERARERERGAFCNTIIFFNMYKIKEVTLNYKIKAPPYHAPPPPQ